jgi:Uma2 family endonuclease
LLPHTKPEAAMTKEPISSYEAERGKPLPDLYHAVAQSNLIGMPGGYRQQYTILSELSLVLNGQPLCPDLCIYPKRKHNWGQDVAYMTEAPLTAIEILSPGQGFEVYESRFAVYFAAGVKSCWFVQPSLETISVLTPDGQLAVFHEELLTDPINGITLNTNEIFAQ